MSTLTQYTTERNKPTTEWDDVRRKHGIEAPDLPPLEEPEPTDEGPFPEATVVDAPEPGSGAADDDDDEVVRLRTLRLEELRGELRMQRRQREMDEQLERVRDHLR